MSIGTQNQNLPIPNYLRYAIHIVFMALYFTNDWLICLFLVLQSNCRRNVWDKNFILEWTISQNLINVSFEQFSSEMTTYFSFCLINIFKKKKTDWVFLVVKMQCGRKRKKSRIWKGRADKGERGKKKEPEIEYERSRG